MGNVIVLLIIILILALSITKVVKEKKKGVKCIGCPHSKGCSSNCNITIKK
ncbi:FeoB-associated Cys-rich membrane protein [Clostridium sp. NSJ-49]|uniref:Virus attachment protein p12 family n=1 Tax=Clostridium disporicum TaxID=84024 RepID=A0A174H6X7_9CLOT|nr:MULTISPECIES: FeoB-associated Cys-rich membrane protein [Clostridium]MBC5626276.1 FeoB-associated Cys-rich membrane protein [Clostridium sp. NSJ-49]MCD2503111.1 FeoB-associated Cys-rich membrane protein [Clostridium sp. NSJ-145]MDU6340320.1 FeoB-associated Cys-rich membrane protein [Clostridium sp.]CUO68605.1 Virus attachment protein p12 family [Clostridium disporicum]